MDRPSAAQVCAHGKALAVHLGSAFTPDPTAIEERYDVTSYDLDLTLDPVGKRISGSVTMRFRVLAGPLDTLELDLDDTLQVQAVVRDGIALRFHHQEDLLGVRLDRPHETTEEAAITVTYSGTPRGGALTFTHPMGHDLVSTLGEPFGGHTWWPCKDHPEDKADSVDVRIHAPSGMLAVSNGVLRQQTDDGVASHSWWHEGYPIATYLVSLAVYPYTLYSEWYHPVAEPRRPGTPDSMEIRFYNYPSSVSEVREVQAKVKEMIAAYSHAFGEYPFIQEKYGHAEFDRAGMEHQTISSMGDFSEAVVVHELAHQWWGDMVTCRTFHDVWLNEGFATYAEAIWAEAQGGPEAYRTQMERFTYYGPGTVYCPDLEFFGRIFSGDLSYHKGSWVVHMLRHVVGDETFFEILQEYRRRFEGGVASTDDFRTVAEDVWGHPLDWFFQEWVYGERHPIYSYSWESGRDGALWTLQLRLLQVQSWSVFTMPVDVVVQTAAGTMTFTPTHASADTTYTFVLSAEPEAVSLDPDGWILKLVLPPGGVLTRERPILLVNGCHWRGSGAARLSTSYEARAFVGSYAHDFWDTQEAPSDGYPRNLPVPLGHGPVPAEVLRRYATVIWVARDDGAPWLTTPIYSQLENGGNVILLACAGGGFLIDPYQVYLGIDLSASCSFGHATAAVDGLPDLRVDSPQAPIPSFPLPVSEESTVLYTDACEDGGIRGLGVIRQPRAGGVYDPEGGRFVYIAGQPESWNAADLRECIEFLLSNFVPHPTGPPEALFLRPAYPNPAWHRANLAFYLSSPGLVGLSILDVAGRSICQLRKGTAPAGWNSEIWDGRTDSGHPAGSGVYMVRLEAGGHSRVGRLVMIR